MSDECSDVPWHESWKLPPLKERPKDDSKMRPIRRYDCPLPVLPKYISSFYDPSAGEFYLLDENQLNQMLEAVEAFQKPIEDYEDAIIARNREISDQTWDITGDHAKSGSKQEAFENQSGEQRKLAYEQQIADLKAKQETAKEQLGYQQNGINYLNTHGPDSTTDESGKVVITPEAQARYDSQMASYVSAAKGLEAQIQALQQGIDQASQFAETTGVGGYLEPQVYPDRETKDDTDLEQKRKELIGLLDPCVNTDDLKELLILNHPKYSGVSKSYFKKSVYPWQYLSKKAYESIREKLAGVAISIGGEDDYTFEKATGQRRSMLRTAKTSISTSDFGGTTVSDSDTTSLRPLTFSELKRGMMAQGVEFEPDDYKYELHEKINGTLAELNHEFANGDNFMNMNASAEAAMLRYSAQASTYYGYDAKLRSVGFGENLTSDLDAFRGVAKANGHFPNNNGVEIILQNGNERISLGVFLLSIEMELMGYAGVSTLLSSNAIISQDAVTDYIKQKVGRVDPDAKANLIKGSMNASGGVGSFAGVEAGCALTGEIQWGKANSWNGYKYVIDLASINSDNPGVAKYVGSTASKLAGMKTLTKLTYTINADVGAGFHGAYYVGYDKNKGQFTFSLSAQMCFGAGWRGSFACVIGTEAIKEMLLFLYEQLLLTNFNVEQLLSTLMDKLAYQTLSQLIVVAIWTGEKLESLVKAGQVVSENIRSGFGKIEDMIATFSLTMSERLARMKAETELADHILASDHAIIEGSTPTAKGNLLYHLSCFDPILYEQQAPQVPEAMVAVLSSINNATEFLQVLTNMVDSQKPKSIPASQGAKQLITNNHKNINVIEKIRAQYVRVLNITKAQILNSTNEPIKNDLLAAYQCLAWVAKNTVFIADNSFDVAQAYNLSNSDKQLFASRMQQPNLVL
ncbi:hypothetical protein OAO18_07025 [Francisellaceae bacterium]|nr:hypothetical protein [Francisellaceae bacterium]